MPKIKTSDGVELYVEETGEGTPVLFIHEYAGDHRSWEPQVRHFSRMYRCITYNARGYPPSDVPDDVSSYSQDRAREDARDVLDALGIDKSHVVGLSMGGFATVHFGIHHADRAISLTVAGCGYGAEKGKQDQFRAEADAVIARLEAEGMEKVADTYAHGPTRVQFERKDPRGFSEFRDQLAEHSTRGSALTQMGVQRRRPSLYDLEDQLKTITVPTLVITGDEDDPCLLPNVFLKQVIPSAGLAVVPNSGHTLNLEEPALFNAFIGDLFAKAEAGRWPMRDPRSQTGSILGVEGDRR